ncbi:MAG: hypothetical protein PF447_01695 [Spirochaetaceae bacterium]|jgi:hypothetical protein|nr:hypothetical protein [Spirochaetaceae bacterium]
MIEREDLIIILSGILSQKLSENSRSINLGVLIGSRLKDVLPNDIYEFLQALYSKGTITSGRVCAFPSKYSQEIKDIVREATCSEGMDLLEYSRAIHQMEEDLLEQIVLGNYIGPDDRPFTTQPLESDKIPGRSTKEEGLSLFIANGRERFLLLPPGRNVIFGGGANSYKTPLVASILSSHMEVGRLHVFWISTRCLSQEVYKHFYALNRHIPQPKDELPEDNEICRVLPDLTVFGINHFASKLEEHQLKVMLSRWLSDHQHEDQVVVALDGLEEIAHLIFPFQGKQNNGLRRFVSFIESIIKPYRERVSVMATYRLPERTESTLQRRIDNYDIRMKILGFNFLEVSDSIMSRAQYTNETGSDEIISTNGVSEYGKELYKAGVRALAEADSISTPYGQYGPEVFEQPPELARFFDIGITLWTNTLLRENHSILVKTVKNHHGVVDNIPARRSLIQQGNESTDLIQYKLNSVEINNLSESKIVLDMAMENDAL